MSEAQKKLQELSESYQSLQAGREANPPRANNSLTTNAELGTAVESRQKLESQQQENTTVKKVRCTV